MKIGIGGIRFSPELVQYAHHAVSPADRSLTDLLRRLAEHRINLSFACTSVVGETVHSTFCLAAGDFAAVEMLLDAVPSQDEHASCRSPAGAGDPGGPSLRARFEITHRVGTLTIFPHRRSLLLLGHVVETLAQAGIAIHSMCTSISALAINIDYLQLDRAVEALDKIVELPENHAPYRPELCIRQIALPSFRPNSDMQWKQ